MLANIETILEWSKSSQNMSMWLFGMDTATTQISFAKKCTTTFEENLMYEQEVFKSFVSWHLLDWLYPYIKKNTFLSWLNVEKNVWPYKIIGYVSNIQRAKKKWFFIEIEDISWKREFFMKELLDVQKFDMVVISWFKQQWRYPKMDKMVITDRETLIKLAWWAYDPKMTVTKAKGLRIWEVKRELLEEIEEQPAEEKITATVEETTDDSIWEMIETPETETTVEENYEENIDENSEEDEETEISPLGGDPDSAGEGVNKHEPENYKFNIPSTTWEMNQLKEILNNNPWEIKVQIWLFEKSVSPEWLEKLKNLLTK